MTDLQDASAQAAESARPMPGESEAYRAARTTLLAEEIELRRHKERVAEMRRALPEGPVAPDYRFLDAEGREVTLADLFRHKGTLYTYFWMGGPERQKPCPMCSSVLDAFDATVPAIEERMAFAILGRSPVARQVEWARDKGWRHLRFYQVVDDRFVEDHGLIQPDFGEVPWAGVWTRRDGEVRRFWADEMNGADPGQDPRGVMDPLPLWSILDVTPEGRGA